MLAFKPSAVQALSLGIEQTLDLFFEQIIGVPVIAQPFGMTRAFGILLVAEEMEQGFALLWIVQALAQFGV
ncbi:hypothetical protein D9M71_426960 [compost metagenome]